MSDEKEEQAPLSAESSLRELYETIEPDDGARAVAITLENTPTGKAQMMIAVTGEFKLCQIIMATLMNEVNNMQDLAKQHENSPEDEVHLAAQAEALLEREDLGDEPTSIVS